MASTTCKREVYKKKIQAHMMSKYKSTMATNKGQSTASNKGPKTSWKSQVKEVSRISDINWKTGESMASKTSSKTFDNRPK